MTSIDLAYSGVHAPHIFHCEDESRFFRGGFVGEFLQLLEWIATNGRPARRCRSRRSSFARAGRECATSAATPREHRVRAAGANPEDQRPLSCLRIDELQASSFAGASEEATSSS